MTDVFTAANLVIPGLPITSVMVSEGAFVNVTTMIPGKMYTLTMNGITSNQASNSLYTGYSGKLKISFTRTLRPENLYSTGAPVIKLMQGQSTIKTFTWMKGTFIDIRSPAVLEINTGVLPAGSYSLNISGLQSIDGQILPVTDVPFSVVP